MAEFVTITEVGPRDGLQNEAIPVPTELKLDFISRLSQVGLQHIEATSFVSPKWVPQLADAAELWPKLPPGPAYSALVPNLRGLQTATEVGCYRIALFTAASEPFTKANINKTIEESIQEFREVAAQLRSSQPQAWIRGYISTAFECPYSGIVSPLAVLEVMHQLLEIGVDEISFGDTIGVATPKEVTALLKLILQEMPPDQVVLHAHDTRGTAIANVAAALCLGIRKFDASAAGLGGCPYAKGAGGNLATEDLCYFLTREGISHGVDLESLALASLPVLEHLKRIPQAKVQVAVLAAR